MRRTQIDLSEQERKGLQALALSSGRSQSALNRRHVPMLAELLLPCAKG